MRTVRQLAWAAAAAAATASPAAAQMGGGGGGGGGNTGGNLGNFQTNAPAATTTLNTTGTTGGTNGGSTTGQQTTIPALAAVEQAPQVRAPSTFTGAGGKVDASNFLAPTYVELRSLGVLKNARSSGYTPAGLGSPVFAATGAGGAAGARATTTPTGRTGATATGLTTDPGGQLVALPRQIAYTAQLKFAVPPLPAPRLQADLRGVIDRAGLAASPAGVQVLVDGNAVVLRGAVADGDEARLVEGLVRLTPGVGRITNELTYARP